MTLQELRRTRRPSSKESTAPLPDGVVVREVRREDSGFLLELRNEPRSVAMSGSGQEVALSAHAFWFDAFLSEYPARGRCFLLESPVGKLGFVRFDFGEFPPASATVSIALSPAARGRALSLPFLTHAIDRAEALHPELAAFVARVKIENTVSSRIFVQAGFEPV